jgi:NAD(P)-dependent dehydrogenase (short-subunit alcohol dehydrogenase family)
MAVDFTGMTAVVTGAGSGIGRATALALANANANLLLIDRDKPSVVQTGSLLGSHEARAMIVEADVTDPEQLFQSLRSARERFGALDMAVNNAGVLGPQKKTAELALEEFRVVFEVNVFGVFNCMKAELDIMLEQDGGAIVNVASIAGLAGARRQSAYVASKHAVVGLTKSAALEYARSGIRINAVCPGLVPTPLAQVLVEASGAEMAARAHPIGRLGTPPEIAEAIVWLLSGSASFVTGATLTVDGGFSAS